jgi:Flp pilus assembly protein CpaB
MKPWHVLLIATITCAAGFFLGLMLRGYQAKRALESMLAPVIVAAKDLPVGTLITDPDKQVKKVHFLRETLPPGVMQNSEDCRGKTLGRTVSKNTPVTGQDLIIAESLRVGMIPGWRAVTIHRFWTLRFPVPGSRVDIFGKIPSPEDPDKLMTKIVAENAVILAVNTGSTSNNITVAVKVEQAEELLAAKERGRLEIELHRPDQ